MHWGTNLRLTRLGSGAGNILSAKGFPFQFNAVDLMTV
jgi:hypothetical protein